MPPTNMTTESPTMIPTSEPTEIYTNLPTLSPLLIANSTFGAEIEITFEYTFISASNSNSVSDKEIEMILKNMTNNLLNDQLLTLDNEDCKYQIFYHVMINYENNYVSINASIWVCSMVDQKELLQDLRRH